MKYLNLFILFILFIGFGNVQAVSLPSHGMNAEVENLGITPVQTSKKDSQNKKSKVERRNKIKNFFQFKKLKKALKPAPEFKLLDILLILLIVILLLFVLLLLDGLTRGLLGTLLFIALVVILVLWLMGKI